MMLPRTRSFSIIQPSPADQSARRYQLTGLLLCAVCGRRLEGHWVHSRAGYRCRHGHTSAHRPGEQPRWVYWPEKRLVEQVLQQLTARGVLEPRATVDDLTGYLRSRDAVIVCAEAILTIDDPTAMTDSPPAPETYADEHQVDVLDAMEKGTETETTNAPPVTITAPAAPDPHPAVAQLNDPRSAPISERMRIPAQRRQQKTPTTAILEWNDSGGG